MTLTIWNIHTGKTKQKITKVSCFEINPLGDVGIHWKDKRKARVWLVFDKNNENIQVEE